MSFTDNNAQHSNSKSEKKEAEVFLNPGIEMKNPVSGEVQHISLPWGVPVDTQTFTVKNTNDPAYNAMQILKKKLLDGLQARADQLAPEEEITIPMTLVMRRRKSAVSKGEVDSTNVSELSDFFAMLDNTGNDEVTEESEDTNPFNTMFEKAS